MEDKTPKVISMKEVVKDKGIQIHFSNGVVIDTLNISVKDIERIMEGNMSAVEQLALLTKTNPQKFENLSVIEVTEALKLIYDNITGGVGGG